MALLGAQRKEKQLRLYQEKILVLLKAALGALLQRIPTGQIDTIACYRILFTPKAATHSTALEKEAHCE
jgi:hypothetical protein